MRPILYNQFTEPGGYGNNGKGVLADVISCQVTEELNGSYDLIMKYPIAGIYGADINTRDIILAKPNPRSDPEPFRIYRMTQPINGIVTVYAHHISYDLNDVPVMPFKALTPSGAASSTISNMAFQTPFSISAPMDQYKEGVLQMEAPMNARSVLMGEQNSIASTYFTESAGQIFFSWYTVQIMNRRGADRGFSIVYGKNMTDFVKETNRSDFYNGIMPYIKNSDGSITTLPEKIVMQSPGWAYKKAKIVDFSNMVKENATITNEENLRAATSQYIIDNGVGNIFVSLDVSFINMKDTAEYAQIAQLQDVYLGDTVTVEMPMYGTSTKETCVKTVFDTLTEKFTSISIGKLRRGI